LLAARQVRRQFGLRS